MSGMKRFTVQGTNEAFVCAHCETQVPALENGSVRNHCPHCLHSVHVDVYPGDRAADCGGLLEPVGVEHTGQTGWIILHRCRRCGAERRNKAALDDPRAPDDYDAIVRLSVAPSSR
jgi:DNA-directed RNA polymerase subunit RPC12/RpoP